MIVKINGEVIKDVGTVLMGDPWHYDLPSTDVLSNIQHALNWILREGSESFKIGHIREYLI